MAGAMLRLGKMTDYGVVVMGRMSAAPDRLATAPEIADATGLPVTTVSQVLKTLVSGGLAISQRGAHGGYRLAREPDEITVAEIVAAFEGPVALTACVDGAADACGVESVCLLRGSWDKVNAAVRTALTTVTLTDMLAPMQAFTGFAPPTARRATTRHQDTTGAARG